MRNINNRIASCLVLVAATTVAACSDDGVDSNEEARRAYLGLDESIEKSLNLGFDGFNSASSANISPQSTIGLLTGSLEVTGQVDQGASDNKEMRLYIGMVEYSDGIILVAIEGEEEEVEVNLTYDTSEVQTEQPYLQLSLRDIPDGTFTGELTGVYQLTGDITGEVELNLAMSGAIEDGGDGTVVRVPGTTAVTGTAVSGDGEFAVDVTL
jgi:hypothetical protein